MTTSAATVITDGSVVEVAGSFFQFTTDSTPQASTWAAIGTANTAYITLTPAGVAGSQTLVSKWSSTAPTYDDTKQGYYLSAGSNIRYVGGVYKAGAASYQAKFLLDPMQRRNDMTSGDPAILNMGIVNRIQLGTRANQDTQINFATDAKVYWDESQDMLLIDKAIQLSGIREPTINDTTTEATAFTVLSALIPVTGMNAYVPGNIFSGGNFYGAPHITRTDATTITWGAMRADGNVISNGTFRSGNATGVVCHLYT